MVGQGTLADEDMLLRQMRISATFGRCEGLDCVRQCVGACDRRQERWTGRGQIRVAKRYGGDEMRTGNTHFQGPIRVEITATGVTSEPVPAVVGTAITGRVGPGTLNSP